MAQVIIFSIGESYNNSFSVVYVIFVISEAQRQQGFNDFYARLSQETREWWENDVSRVLSVYAFNISQDT